MSNLSLGELMYGKDLYTKIFNEKLSCKINEVQNSLDNTIKNIPKCIIQLFLKENGQYDTDATAVLIELNESYYIFSASHAVHNDSYIMYKNEFKKIPIEWSIQSNLEQNISEDIYIAKLSYKLNFSDRVYYKINLDHLNYDENSIIGFSGFPYTKNGIKWESKEFKNRPYLYWGSSELLKEDVYDNNRHLKMFQDREKMLSNIGGNVNIAPSPKGISGGGIFKLSNNMEYLSKCIYDVKLIGIGIENKEKLECPLKTRQKIIQ
ncbi:hypothetical protein [Sulfurimonas sp.]